jgi:metal-responsive CopG/Arc/MetJ family transcriptional regulator
MGKERVSVTLDSKILAALEKMRSKEKYKPSLSSVVNSLLENNLEVKKNL